MVHAVAIPVSDLKTIAYAIFAIAVSAMSYLLAKRQRSLMHGAVQRWAADNGFTNTEFLKQVPEGWSFGPARSHPTIRARMTAADGTTRIGYFDLGGMLWELFGERHVLKVIWEDEIASYH